MGRQETSDMTLVFRGSQIRKVEEYRGFRRFLDV
jgi:hypothetical protein